MLKLRSLDLEADYQCKKWEMIQSIEHGYSSMSHNICVGSLSTCTHLLWMWMADLTDPLHLRVGLGGPNDEQVSISIDLQPSFHNIPDLVHDYLAKIWQKTKLWWSFALCQSSQTLLQFLNTADIRRHVMTINIEVIN